MDVNGMERSNADTADGLENEAFLGVTAKGHAILEKIPFFLKISLRMKGMFAKEEGGRERGGDKGRGQGEGRLQLRGRSSQPRSGRSRQITRFGD